MKNSVLLLSLPPEKQAEILADWKINIASMGDQDAKRE